MNTNKQIIFTVFALTIFFTACRETKKKEPEAQKERIVKGLYSFGPEVKSFTSCDNGQEYWVIDSAKTLELAYQDLGFEKPYLPVYTEVECHHIPSDSLAKAAGYDSTMVVTKVRQIIKDKNCK